MRQTTQPNAAWSDPLQRGLEQVRALSQAQRLEDALAEAHRLLGLYPEAPALWLMTGAVLIGLEENEKAVAVLQHAETLRPQAAAQAYLAAAHFNLGDHRKALRLAERATRKDSANLTAHQTLAALHARSDDPGRAIPHYQAVVKADPSNWPLRSAKLHLQARLCDWGAWREFDRIAGQIGVAGRPADPWSLLAFEDDPLRQRRRSEHYASQWQVKRAALPPRGPGKFRLGYFSSDFRDHATLYLLNGLLAHHDRALFDITLYGFNPVPRGSAAFERLIGFGDTYRDLSQASVADSIAIARADQLDIAFDLKGYTADARSALFFQGVAPVQINYLGYPGTLGASCYDYIVADPVVLPEAHAAGVSEHVIRLPGSYQPNDAKREISNMPVSRKEAGLPQDGVVLCCFNNPYKISEREFRIWMAVMGQVDGSVLWLLDGGRVMRARLRKAAMAHGIAPGRLVFAAFLDAPAHLARLQLADLFLDTFNVNAHTTASDALWAGVPVVTRAGRQFAARVGASLLTAVGLPELIAQSDDDYHARLLDLAQNPHRLADLRGRLKHLRDSCALFDSAGYARHFEAAMTQVIQRSRAGEAPRDLEIDAVDQEGSAQDGVAGTG